jgi:hypothetical protein
LIVHDYSSLCWDGAERAVDEFFADKPECLVPLTDSAGSVVIRKSRAPNRHENWYVKKKCEAWVDGWIEANHSSITEILGNGWADLEPWGVGALEKSMSCTFFLPVHRLAPSSSMPLSMSLSRPRRLPTGRSFHR